MTAPKRLACAKAGEGGVMRFLTEEWWSVCIKGTPRHMIWIRTYRLMDWCRTNGLWHGFRMWLRWVIR